MDLKLLANALKLLGWAAIKPGRPARRIVFAPVPNSNQALVTGYPEGSVSVSCQPADGKAWTVHLPRNAPTHLALTAAMLAAEGGTDDEPGDDVVEELRSVA